jgi:hypothetical protein
MSGREQTSGRSPHRSSPRYTELGQPNRGARDRIELAGTRIAFVHRACWSSMVDRRRTRRYVIETPLAGDVMPMDDVIVERFSGKRLVAISLTSHAADEAVLVHMRTPAGLTTQPARVVSSRPTSIGGTLCFRLELRMGEGESPARGERHH